MVLSDVAKLRSNRFPLAAVLSAECRVKRRQGWSGAERPQGLGHNPSQRAEHGLDRAGVVLVRSS